MLGGPKSKMMPSIIPDPSEHLPPASGQPAKAGQVHKGERGVEVRVPSEWLEGRLSLLLVLSGSATYQVGAQRYHVSPASLFWVFPNQRCEALHPSPDHEVWVASFEAPLVERIC